MISVIIPAFDEDQSIDSVVNQARRVLDENGESYEIIVVDDGSSDNTSKVALDAKARIIRHAYKLGNGAAIKTGIRHAQGDVIVMMDGDGQHNPNDIIYLLNEISTHGMVVGARNRSSETSWYRDVANLVYNLLASYICGQSIPDLTSGFRAIHSTLARQFLYLLPNTFSYPTTITLALLKAGHCVKYVPIYTKKQLGRSKINIFRDGFRFIIIVFKIATIFSPIKIFLPISLVVIGLGVGWYLYNFFFIIPKLPPASIIMILSGVLFFLIGLLSEQITQLRYERSEESFAYITRSIDADTYLSLDSQIHKSENAPHEQTSQT